MMNDYCNSCDPCNRCKRACMKPYFNLFADPYDPNYWLWEMNGESGKVKVPSFNETDTKLSVDYSNSALNYSAERHVDTITGEQLGSIINLDDLRDVDATHPDACSILVFNPGCGLCPCAPDEEMWKKYSIPDADEELQPDSQDRYKVLTKTDCGCIEEKYLHIEQPDLDCILTNIINAIKPFSGEGRMIDVEGGGSTPGFTGALNPNTGEFYIQWDDHYISAGVPDPVGTGRVTGRLQATNSVNIETGAVTYTINRITYQTMTYTPHYSGSLPITMTHYVWGCFPGTNDLTGSHASLDNAGLRLYSYQFWGGTQGSVSYAINKTFTGSYSITVPANGGLSNWITTMRLYNDWTIADDDGLTQVRYSNPMSWEQC